MKMKLAVALGVLLFAGTAHADSNWVYTYTGNALQSSGGTPNCQCSVDGSFTLGAPLGDSTSFTTSAFSFSVDGFTFNQSDSIGSLSVQTNASGDIASWFLSVAEIGNIQVNLISSFTGSTNDQNIPYYAIDVYGFGPGPYDSYWLENDPGSWKATDPSSMPEPSTLWLSVLGLALLIGLARRRGAARSWS